MIDVITFKLRPDRSVQVVGIPWDMNAAEAERLSGFVRAFGSDEAIEPRADRRPVPSPRALRAIDTALRLHVPREPTPETLEAMAAAIMHAAELPEEMGELGQFIDGTGQYRKEALAAYRAQPIWQAMWGKK